MATFLELCQRAAKESRTVNTNGSPAAVTGQTQLRLVNLINAVAQAWKDIQNLHSSWLWMRAEFSGQTTASNAKYTAASWSIDSRFAEWIQEAHVVTLYLTSTGVSDEGELSRITWQEWRMKYGRGTQTNNKPTEYAVSPANEFCLGPIPDDTYTVRGEYRKTAQVLAANGDTPEMPVRFHDMIWRKALMLFLGADEAAFQVADFEIQYLADLEELERDQLPRVTVGAYPLDG